MGHQRVASVRFTQWFLEDLGLYPLPTLHHCMDWMSFMQYVLGRIAAKEHQEGISHPHVFRFPKSFRHFPLPYKEGTEYGL